MPKFSFTTDELLMKAENDDYYEIEGLASTPDKDLQGEIIKQNGIDISAVNDGKAYFCANHGYEYKIKQAARMGLIDEVKLTKDGLWVKGKIWKNHPESGIYYNELKYGKKGLVQFSVEGEVRERDLLNKKVIKRAFIKGVALTRDPINPKTYAQFSKSFNPNNNEILPFEVEDIEKGGPNSGRRPTVGPKVPTGQPRGRPVSTESTSHKEHEKLAQKKIVVEPKESPKKDEEAKLIHNKLSTEANERAIRDKMIEQKVEQGSSKKDKKQIRQDIRLHGITGTSRKREEGRKMKVKKSQVVAEIVRRSEENPEFKSKVEELIKAVYSGGPAYSDTPPAQVSGTQVFQQEEKVEDEEKKKKKKELNNKGDK